MARLDRPDFHRIVGHSRLAGRINGFLVNLKDSLLSHNRRPDAVFAGICHLPFVSAGISVDPES